MRLPRLLLSRPSHLTPHEGLYLERLSIDEMIREVAAARVPVVLDLDSIEGLGADEAAVDFCGGRLGVAGVVTRSPGAVILAADRGLASLIKVHALDAIGLAHTLAAIPRHPGVGCAVSPGPVLPHLSTTERAALPRPVLALGLIHDRDLARRCLEGGADSAVVLDSRNPVR